MKRYILFLFNILFVAITSTAQHLTVNVPSNVSAGENVRLSYTINTQNVDDFVIGNIPEELEMITGPYVSSQSSYSMVNGHTARQKRLLIYCMQQRAVPIPYLRLMLLWVVKRFIPKRQR